MNDHTILLEALEEEGIDIDVLFECYLDNLMEEILSEAEEKQKHTSAKTSLNQISRGLKHAPVNKDDIGVDVGGGKYDKGVEHFKKSGAQLHVYDPYNRAKEHNDDVEKNHCGKANYVGCHNVLNVIKEPEHRKDVLNKLKQFMHPETGKAHLTVYQGKKHGIGSATKGGESWQNHQPTKFYRKEIEDAFDPNEHDVADYKGGYLVSKRQKIKEQVKSIVANLIESEPTHVIRSKQSKLERLGNRIARNQGYTDSDEVVNTPLGKREDGEEPQINFLKRLKKLHKTIGTKRIQLP